MLHPIRLMRARRLDKPLSRAQALSRACGAVCEMHGLSLRLTGRAPPEPVIYASNHLGYVDPVAICSLLPSCPIAKSEVASWPVIGNIARRMDVIFVRRGDPVSGMRALRAARRRLLAGTSILSFPEGTTTRGSMRGFQRGVFGLSRWMDVPVVPVSVSFDRPELCWVDDDDLIRHYGSVLLGQRHSVHVEVGPLLRCAPGETPERFAARVRAWIANAQMTRCPTIAGHREALSTVAQEI